MDEPLYNVGWRRAIPGELVTDPIYKQVSDLLLKLVQTDYRPGSQFLTERQISERFSISRTTANKALANLVVTGVLQFRKGVGTFVAPPKANVDLKRLVSFTERARAAGHDPQTRTRSFSLTTIGGLQGISSLEAARVLGVGPETPVYQMERIRSIDGEPVVYERRVTLAKECEGLTRDETEGSLYGVFAGRFGHSLAGVSQRIRARAATSSQARVFGGKPGEPLLELAGVGYRFEEAAAVPLWYEITLYRGNAYEFVNQVRSEGAPATGGVSHLSAGSGNWFAWGSEGGYE